MTAGAQRRVSPITVDAGEQPGLTEGGRVSAAIDASNVLVTTE